MKHAAVRFSIIFAVTIMSQVAPSQSVIGTNPPEMKSVPVPIPNGLVRAEAREINKDWVPPVVHLKGDANVRIYTATKDPRGVIVMRADEVDINQNTGEISPRGNVRLTVEKIK